MNIHMKIDQQDCHSHIVQKIMSQSQGLSSKIMYMILLVKRDLQIFHPYTTGVPMDYLYVLAYKIEKHSFLLKLGLKRQRIIFSLVHRLFWLDVSWIKRKKEKFPKKKHYPQQKGMIQHTLKPLQKRTLMLRPHLSIFLKGQYKFWKKTQT